MAAAEILGVSSVELTPAFGPASERGVERVASRKFLDAGWKLRPADDRGRTGRPRCHRDGSPEGPSASTSSGAASKSPTRSPMSPTDSSAAQLRPTPTATSRYRPAQVRSPPRACLTGQRPRAPDLHRATRWAVPARQLLPSQVQARGARGRASRARCILQTARCSALGTRTAPGLAFPSRSLRQSGQGFQGAPLERRGRL